MKKKELVRHCIIFIPSAKFPSLDPYETSNSLEFVTVVGMILF